MLRLVAGLALVASLAVGAAQAAPAEQTPRQTAVAPEKTGDWTEADYKAVRDRDEARQRAWDRKMKALTESICKGC
jgi:hypothetical protein